MASGQPLAHWDFHIALACFKLAIITAGIDFRNRMGSSADSSDRAGQAVAPLIAGVMPQVKMPAKTDRCLR